MASVNLLSPQLHVDADWTANWIGHTRNALMGMI
jgi:hypothetical protein